VVRTIASVEGPMLVTVNEKERGMDLGGRNNEQKGGSGTNRRGGFRGGRKGITVERGGGGEHSRLANCEGKEGKEEGKVKRGGELKVDPKNSPRGMMV